MRSKKIAPDIHVNREEHQMFDMGSDYDPVGLHPEEIISEQRQALVEKGVEYFQEEIFGPASRYQSCGRGGSAW